MAYSNRRGGYRRSTGGAGSRWMELRYAGTCKVCGNAVAKGETAYYDAAAKTVTCHGIECCDADGLTTHDALTGPWDKRTDTRRRLERRIGDAAPVVTRLNSGAVITRNARGRCEDAPCCGCCD